MTLTPVRILLSLKYVIPRLGVGKKVEKQADTIDEKHSVIIAGFSHDVNTIGCFLRTNGVEATILDQDSDTVSLLRMPEDRLRNRKNYSTTI